MKKNIFPASVTVKYGRRLDENIELVIGSFDDIDPCFFRIGAIFSSLKIGHKFKEEYLCRFSNGEYIHSCVNHFSLEKDVDYKECIDSANEFFGKIKNWHNKASEAA